MDEEQVLNYTIEAIIKELKVIQTKLNDLKFDIAKEESKLRLYQKIDSINLYIDEVLKSDRAEFYQGVQLNLDSLLKGEVCKQKNAVQNVL